LMFYPLSQEYSPKKHPLVKKKEQGSTHYKIVYKLEYKLPIVSKTTSYFFSETYHTP